MSSCIFQPFCEKGQAKFLKLQETVTHFWESDFGFGKSFVSSGESLFRGFESEGKNERARKKKLKENRHTCAVLFCAHHRLRKDAFALKQKPDQPAGCSLHQVPCILGFP